jgi:predicted TIM-barrel enzyme
MADFETHEGRGPFGDIRNVPTLVILDGEGRETFRRQGPLTAAEIEAELKRASRGVSEKRFAP